MKTMKKNNKLQVLAIMLAMTLVMSLTTPVTVKAEELGTDVLANLIEDEMCTYGGRGSSGGNFGRLNSWIAGSSSSGSQENNNTLVVDNENDTADNSSTLFNQRVNLQSVK